MKRSILILSLAIISCFAIAQEPQTPAEKRRAYFIGTFSANPWGFGKAVADTIQAPSTGLSNVQKVAAFDQYLRLQAATGGNPTQMWDNATTGTKKLLFLSVKSVAIETSASLATQQAAISDALALSVED